MKNFMLWDGEKTNPIQSQTKPIQSQMAAFGRILEGSDDQIANNKLKLENPEFFRQGYLKKQSQFSNGQNELKYLCENCL